MKSKTLEVEIIRGSQVESRHQVVASIYSREPKNHETFGDDNILVFPRSSLKPIQALPLILTKAADRFSLSNQELALACASHRGETFHITLLRDWMQKIGVTEADLECGAHPPAHIESHLALISHHERPSAIHNNCSGKHIGMLTTAIHLQEPIKNYVSQKHPVQTRILKSIEKLCQVNLNQNTLGIDGCSIPAPSMPLKKLAQGFCEFIDPIHLASAEADAAQKILLTCTSNPFLAAGTGHYCSEIMKQLQQDQVLLKGGAEGVMTGAIPKLKLGFALKALDGNSRATEFCTSMILNKFGLLPDSSPYLKPIISNWNNIETGYIRLATSTALDN